MSAKQSEIKNRLAIVEMEVGFLRTIRKSPNPEHSVAAGQVEIERLKEIEQLKEELSLAS